MDYPRVKILWNDIIGDSGWSDEKEMNEMKYTDCVSEGYLYKETEDMVLTFASYEIDCTGKIISFGDRNAYPKGCIKEIIYT